MNRFKNRYRIESARLSGWNYSGDGYYFVTVCTRNRECNLGRIENGKMVPSAAGRVVEEEWKRTGQIRSDVRLDTWVMMPNHLHGIVILQNRKGKTPVETPRRGVCLTPRRGVCLTPHRGVSTANGSGIRLQSGSLGAVIGQFKSVSTKRIRAAGVHDFGWQPRFYDHIIRDENSLRKIQSYILNNPLAWDQDQENPVKP